MLADIIKFPIIEINLVDYLVDEHSNAESESFFVTNPTAVNSGYHNDAILVDREGTAYKICGAKILEYQGFMARISKSLATKVKVDFLVEGEPYPISLDEFKKLIFKCVDESYEIYSGNVDFDEWMGNLKSAQTIDDIFKAMLYES